MKILEILYEKRYGKPAPYYYKYSLMTIIKKPIRKFITNVITPNCPFNNIRIFLYKLCGFDIGDNVFIGMKCYLDDMCFDKIHIGNDVIISYGVYFACHGKGQGHQPIFISDKAYIGMRAIILSKNSDCEKKSIHIGNGSVVGASTLVNKDVPDNSVAVGIPCKIINK